MMAAFRSARTILDWLAFEVASVVWRGLMLAANLVNDTRPRGAR